MSNDDWVDTSAKYILIGCATLFSPILIPLAFIGWLGSLVIEAWDSRHG